MRQTARQMMALNQAEAVTEWKEVSIVGRENDSKQKVRTWSLVKRMSSRQMLASKGAQIKHPLARAKRQIEKVELVREMHEIAKDEKLAEKGLRT